MRKWLIAVTLIGCQSAAGEPLGEPTGEGTARASAGPSEAPPVLGNRRLQLVARHGVPLADATGIACDGSHVWLVAGGHNAPSHTFAHVDLATGATETSFAVPDLIGRLGTGVYGLTLLDGFLYVTVSGNTNAIVRIDPATGAIDRQLAAPTELGPSDLDVSGGHLVESDGTGKVFTLSPETGAIVAQFAAGTNGRNHGLAVRGNDAFVGSLFGGMDAYDVRTGAHLGAVIKEDGSALEGNGVELGSMCFDGPRLRILSLLGISEYDVLAP